MDTKRREATATPVSKSTVVLDTRTAADFLGVSPRTLEGFRVRGGGPPFVKIGGAVRYRLRSLETYLEQRERASTCDPGQAFHAPAAPDASTALSPRELAVASRRRPCDKPRRR
jgi:hypothetical protein